MEHWVLRCKHCKKEYTYCTYGNGPQYGTEEGCSKEYCSECQKAIDEALDKIPLKFKPIEEEIKDDNLLQELLAIKENPKTNAFPSMTKLVMSMDFDFIDRYTHNGRIYIVKYDESSPKDRHLFVKKEFDILNKKATGKYWKAETYEDTYQHGTSCKSTFQKLRDIPIRPLSPPSGEIFYRTFSPDF